MLLADGDRDGDLEVNLDWCGPAERPRVVLNHLEREFGQGSDLLNNLAAVRSYQPIFPVAELPIKMANLGAEGRVAVQQPLDSAWVTCKLRKGCNAILSKDLSEGEASVSLESPTQAV